MKSEILRGRDRPQLGRGCRLARMASDGMNSSAGWGFLPVQTGDRRALIFVKLGKLRAGLGWFWTEFRSKKYAENNGKLMVAKNGFWGSAEVIGVDLGGLGGVGMGWG